ncbi:MAG: glycosyltransferase family 2 protein [Roseovarius sp.]|nr:glycosyltransferase family 2 protein [Roseovarius sp.]
MSESRPSLSIILPAHNEADFMAPCLGAVLASDDRGFDVQLIVIANACTDNTVQVAESFVTDAQRKGWRFEVINTAEPGKLNALNLGDAQAKGTVRAYLDADVVVTPDLMRQIVAALHCDAPLYASGSPVVSPAKSGVTRAYGRVWQRLPFVTTGVPGFGLFAVNSQGRARWGAFPDIISDDTFVRLSFAPNERLRVPATYSWPMVEGLHNLVRVRRRQDKGVEEIAEQCPELLQNDNTPKPGMGPMLRIALSDPIGFGVYLLVKLAVKTPYARSAQRWARGR